MTKAQYGIRTHDLLNCQAFDLLAYSDQTQASFSLSNLFLQGYHTVQPRPAGYEFNFHRYHYEPTES